MLLSPPLLAAPRAAQVGTVYGLQLVHVMVLSALSDGGGGAFQTGRVRREEKVPVSLTGGDDGDTKRFIFGCCVCCNVEVGVE